MMNCEDPVPGVPAILSDNRAGGRIATDHLLRLGHRSIGHLSAPPTHGAAAPRLAGVRDALGAAGLNPEGPATATGDGHVAGGQRAMNELMERAPDVTAVVCYNDMTAIGAIRSLRARGRHVPQDVSVVGFDDLDIAGYVDPTLTTVAQQKGAMGRWAVERLTGLIGTDGSDPLGGRATEFVRLPVRLIERESTAQPGGAGGR